MKVLLLINRNEAKYVNEVSSHIEDDNFELQIFEFTEPTHIPCKQISEINKEISDSDTIVYFATSENEKNTCLNNALIEAARLSKKIICIWLEPEAKISDIFESLGDCLLSEIAQLPEALNDTTDKWENSDGSIIEERKLKRYKCGGNQ